MRIRQSVAGSLRDELEPDDTAKDQRDAAEPQRGRGLREQVDPQDGSPDAPIPVHTLMMVRLPTFRPRKRPDWSSSYTFVLPVP
jgi:hypothetical protein